ncbi:MAG: PP-loop family protein [Bilophila wadsworthia]
MRYCRDGFKYDRRVSGRNRAPAASWRLGVLAAGNRFALAYSGGLDSRFLAHAAQRFGFEPVLLHIVGPHIPPEETDYARHWAASRELAYEELPTDPLDLALVASGDRRRCYACKRNLFSLLKARTDLPLCDGTNASDAGQYRPGIRAVEELGILSPLASAGLAKADIHRCAALTGMEDPSRKPGLLADAAPVRHEAGAFPARGACRR